MSDCQLCARHPHEPGAEHTAECKTRRADVGQICRSCASRIAINLDSILECWALTAIPPWPTCGGDGRAKSSPLPGSTEWMDYRHGAAMHGTLTSWVRDWMETWNLAGPRRNDLASLIGWLRTHLEHAAEQHPALDDFAHEIAHLARRGRTMAGLTDHRGMRIECPTQDCGANLRANTADPDDEVTCKNCGRHWTVSRLLTVSFAGADEAWVDREAAESWTGMTFRTLNRWAVSGRINKRGQLFDLRSIRLDTQETA